MSVLQELSEAQSTQRLFDIAIIQLLFSILIMALTQRAQGRSIPMETVYIIRTVAMV